MSKEEVIKQAYGEHWEQVKGYVNDYGFLMSIDIAHHNWKGLFTIEFEFFHDGYMCRPKSLQGIENNNGWIKINSEDDLPKESLLFWVKLNSKGINEFFHNKTSDGITYNRFMPNSQFYIEEWMKYVTHYQLAITPPKPLY